MKEGQINDSGEVEVRDVPKPIPGPGQVLIKTVVTGTNPKDWKVFIIFKGSDSIPRNQGDDIAGYVDAVGDGVQGFHPGDRVAAFHQGQTPHGSYAEYSIAWARSTFHLPPNTSFEEAATIPLAGMTAALSLYQRLRLPLPWNPATGNTPLVVYGGASAVGAFAIKLAGLSNIHPIISVAGNGIPFVKDILDESKGDRIIDYRLGDDHVVEMLNEALKGEKFVSAFDAVSEKGSTENISRIEVPEVLISTVLPTRTDHLPPNVTVDRTTVSSVHEAMLGDSPERVEMDRKFGAVFFPYFGLGLAEGWFKGHPYEVVEGGLNGLTGALKALKEGKASAKKFVARIADTKDIL